MCGFVHLCTAAHTNVHFCTLKTRVKWTLVYIGVSWWKLVHIGVQKTTPQCSLHLRRAANTNAHQCPLLHTNDKSKVDVGCIGVSWWKLVFIGAQRTTPQCSVPILQLIKNSHFTLISFLVTRLAQRQRMWSVLLSGTRVVVRAGSRCAHRSIQFFCVCEHAWSRGLKDFLSCKN